MYQLADMANSIIEAIQILSDQLFILSANNELSELLPENVLEQYQLIIQPIAESMQFIKQFHKSEHLNASIQQLDEGLSNYNLYLSNY